MNTERKSETIASFIVIVVALMLFMPLLLREKEDISPNESTPVFLSVNLPSEIEYEFDEFDVDIAVEEYIELHTPKYVFPLDGEITSPFAMRTDPITLHEEEFHLGIDISAKKDVEISSYADGVVKKAVTNDKDYGMYLIIEHNGFETLYAHCSSLLVSEGDSVYAGDIIAIAGSTGRSTGVHLHFEVRANGERIDPLLHMEQNGVKRYA